MSVCMHVCSHVCGQMWVWSQMTLDVFSDQPLPYFLKRGGCLFNPETPTCQVGGLQADRLDFYVGTRDLNS